MLIVADALGWGDVGFNGRMEWTTPHLLGNLGQIGKEPSGGDYLVSVLFSPKRELTLIIPDTNNPQ